MQEVCFQPPPVRSYLTVSFSVSLPSLFNEQKFSLLFSNFLMLCYFVRFSSPEWNCNFWIRWNASLQQATENIFTPNNASRVCFSQALFDPHKTRRRSESFEMKQRVLKQCAQTDVVVLEEVLSRFDASWCKKLGEGVYGEVFRCHDDVSSIALKVRLLRFKRVFL